MCWFYWNFWWVVLVTFWGFKNATTTTDHSPAHICAPFIYPSSFNLEGHGSFSCEWDWICLNDIEWGCRSGILSLHKSAADTFFMIWSFIALRLVSLMLTPHSNASKVGDRPEKLPLPTSFQLLHLIHILLGRPCSTPFDLSISSKLTTKEKAPKLISAEKTDQNQCSSAVQSKGSARNWCVHERQLDFWRC